MNRFLFSMQWQGLPIKEAQRDFQKIKLLNAKELKAFQEQSRMNIIRHHQEFNPWYKNFLGSRDITHWESIPFINKKDIQVPLHSIISSGYKLSELYLNNTSGSTGIPFHFAKDKYSHALTWAGIIDRYQSIGIRYGSSFQARFFGIPLSKRKYYREKLKDWFSSRQRFVVFDLSDRALDKHLSEFEKHKFEYLYGYTNSLLIFARYLQNRGLVLKNICPTLICCIVTSEVCFPEDRLVMQKSFGVTIVNEYGAAELDLIAFEDLQGNFILNEENLFIEVLNSEGKEVGIGEEGEVVVTSLFNKAMPFIRYKLGDRIVLRDYRINGRRVIEKVQGRMNDNAILPSGRVVPGLTFYYVSKSLLEEGGVIKEFTIDQVASNVFNFKYVSDEVLSDIKQQQVKKLMDQYLEPGLHATFERVGKIERTLAGKFKHFQSLIKKP